MKKQQNKWYTFILRGIMHQLQTYLRDLGVIMDVKQQGEIVDFIGQNLNGAVELEFVDALPTLEGEIFEVRFEAHILKLLRTRDDGKVGKHELYAAVEKQYEVAFRKLWLGNYFPKNLLEEAIPLLDLKKPIIVLAYERPSLWRENKAKAHGITVIGQKINPETGYFVERKPIGYIERKGQEQWVVITAPNERLDYTAVTLKFNK